MSKKRGKRWICGILTAVLLTGSLSDFSATGVYAAEQVSETTAAFAAEQTAEVLGDLAAEQEPDILAVEAETGTGDGQEQAVSIQVTGEGIVEGLAQGGLVQPGGEVSIEVTRPGSALVLVTEDEKGGKVYTAMALDTANRYTFTAAQDMEFVIVDPDTVDYTIRLADSRKAKLTGEAGLKLNSVGSSAQGYDEVVLNFTAVKNGSDGTDTASVYYEVQVVAVDFGVGLPAGSPREPVYCYIPKKADQNTQSKSLKVNDGELSEPTQCIYEFATRLVLVSDQVVMPDENTYVKTPIDTELAGNTVTKQFSTKNLYYEDKIGFKKKTTKLFTGQENVLVGSVQYSKKASYIHDLTAVAYDGDGGVCGGLTCTFRNDNDELYVSSAYTMKPGTYKIVVYAGIGETVTQGTPQGGTMYQANTSFSLTVQPGISSIDTSGITRQAAVNNKDITFSAVPVGYSYYNTQKAKSQKFTYEIKSAFIDSVSGEFFVTDPVDKVKNNVTVNKSGKVTVKRGYYVSPDTDRNYIAVVITAADFAGNTTTATAYVQIVVDALVPTQIYLANASGKKIVSSKDEGKHELTADKVHEAKVIVLDQYGNNMNAYVDITPSDNAKGTAGIYVEQSSESGEATLYVRKLSAVTIKAVTKDGGKKSETLKLNVLMPEFTGGYYTIDSVTCDGFRVEGVRTGTGVVYYSALRGAQIRYRQGAKVNGVGCYHWDWFDWKFSVKGGSAKRDGEYLVVTPTQKTAEVTMWLKDNPAQNWSVEFTNNGWDDQYDDPPTVSLVSGKLYSKKYTNAANLEVDEETGAYTIPAQRLTYKYNFGSYDKINVAAITKNAPALTLENFDPANRRFDLVTDEETLKPGTYRYKVAFYIGTRLMGKPATITVKVTKSTAVKLAASYTLYANMDSAATLQCKPQDFVPDFSTTLMNANVGGRSNDFSKYFRLVISEESGTRQALIRLKSGLTEEELEQIQGKKFVGYVRYSYYYGNAHIQNATAKVTIKVK